MAENSNIQWTDATWNPTTGCTKISPGCANCYIASTPPFRMAGRKFVGGKITLELHEDRLNKPLRWKKPKRVFVNSLSDLFHEDVPDKFIDCVLAVAALAPQHTYQILTKRHERMVNYMTSEYRPGAIQDACRTHFDRFDFGIDNPMPWPIPSVWMGVTTENQAAADERIPHLLRVPAAVRFLSCEPLLGPVDLGDLLTPVVNCEHKNPDDGCCGHPDRGSTPECHVWACPRKEARQPINWVIVGGESGPGARPCNVAWIRSIVEQCKAAGVPCFVKQLGSVPYDSSPGGGCECFPDDTPITKHRGCHLDFRDKKGGDPAEWCESLRIREFPTVKAGAS